jgi:probable FeS assembly SUF system protein SufT
MTTRQFINMQNATTIELTRDCEAVQIPAGMVVTLPAHTPVDITQTLGGTYTIRAQGGLYRIAAKDLDALGIESASAILPGNSGKTGSEATTGAMDEKLIWDTLKTCYDPEIPVNIVDLGLVYDMRIDTLPDGKHAVAVKMTLTAPGCGMGGVIAGDAQQKLLELPCVDEAMVEIVWDPPWHQSMITADGRKILGLE